ncbi:MAG TPA: tetratricopeptide repeat protein [Bryobacteraceae bacterium]|nr:tetratricopeptide repeat protein [Bryobacteraceae bacterium]
MSNRLEALQGMLSQDPKNTFVRYGLAMELANVGRLDEAVDEYKRLIETDPNYAAAYFHGGRALEKLGQVEEARAMYEQGIAVTTRTGDMHTRSELQAALDLL